MNEKHAEEVKQGKKQRQCERQTGIHADRQRNVVSIEVIGISFIYILYICVRIMYRVFI